MNDTTRQSDDILASARQSLALQREGGIHRRAGSVGREAARFKWRHWKRKLGRLALAVGGVWLAAGAVGLIIDGIGFTGVMLTALATLGAVFVFARYPRLKPPRREELKKGDPRTMVARTELWLEHQRAALPPPAARLVDQLGVQLDELSRQLETVDANHDCLGEIRELVGEYIPATIENYQRIPASMRAQRHAGGTADERLVESLSRLSGEVERVARRLAEGALDDLAIKTRYLEYRYGGAEALEDKRS